MRFLGRSSSPFRVSEALAKETQLPPEQENLTTGEQSKDDSGTGQHNRPNNEAPFVRRFFLALGSLLFCALGGFFGFQDFYNKRLFVGTCWTVSGLLIGGGGMASDRYYRSVELGVVLVIVQLHSQQTAV